MSLLELREQITEIDFKIINLISERISLVPNLVKYKKDNQISVFQPEREKQMHSRYWKAAAEKKVNPELIRQIFELIINEMRELQYEALNNE